MNDESVNIHATAIVVGTCGLLFTGPSGSGKSTLAFNCLAAARQRGMFGALISDDQVFVRRQAGCLIATAPPAIAGLLELRGCGIVQMDTIAEAPLHLAIRVVDIATTERLPPPNEIFDCAGLASLPMIRMRAQGIDPLAGIAALRPELRGELGI
jgi:serine kinase of HPr protein (carbohydrate metabolism regulator)